ncbi:uncharacterized protein LOC133192614 [Saccostrea echinata]|uniref:uncharacterized protein LOC133192614 n=1 Tax=Saccostrea echinata TaxID=191078 RepID=UPI002A7ED033|nr:uncharacterized protein LOC133192614 [Saccostrea echinata]
MSFRYGRRLIGRAILSSYLHRGCELSHNLNLGNYLQSTYYAGSFPFQNNSGDSKPQQEVPEKKWSLEYAGGVLEKIRSKDKTFYSVSIKDVIQRIQRLEAAQLSGEQIEWLMEESPYFLQGKNTEPIVNMLQDHGLGGRSICVILLSYGRVTDEDPSVLSDLLMFLRKIYKTDRKFNKAITACPGILSVTPAKITAKINELQELFKSNDVLELTVQSPDILFEDLDTIQEKFDYVYHTMGISQRQMMYSDMFNYPLLHIQTRHAFLDRAGFYKKIKKHKGEINTNPLLQDILGLSDKSFARKYGNMSELDYKTFSQYFALELENMAK